MNIREALVNYHEEYEKAEEMLHHAEIAIEDLEARTGATSISSSGGGPLFQGRYRTIGASLVRRYVEEGGIKFIGERVECPAKLAALMQEYRNPLFETLRLVYMKDEYIMAVEGFSNHLPDLVVLPFKDTEAADHVKARMDSLDADGYYMLHNHPSGDPKPSLADRHLTYTLAKQTDGFLGHIVTDHVRYALIDADAEYKLLQLNVSKKDQFLGASIEHPLINQTVGYPNDVAVIGKSLQVADHPEISNLVYLTAKNEIRMVQEISNSLFENDKLKDWLISEMHSVGATGVCCITSNANIYDVCTPYVETRHLKDVVYIDPDYPFYWSKKEEGIKAKAEYISAGKTEQDIKYYTSFQSVKKSQKTRSDEVKRPISRSF